MQHYLFQHEESNGRGLPESNITRLCCTSSTVAPGKLRILTILFFPDKRCSRIPFMNLVFEGYWPWIVAIAKTFSLVLPLLLSLTLFRIDFFGAAHGWGGGERGFLAPLSKICQSYPTMMKFGTVIPYLRKIRKIYNSRYTSLEFCWHQHFFTGNQ